MRGADLLVQTLARAGVTTIYTLSGNQIMPVFDACLDVGIRLIHTRHEGAAVFMAEAHAQLTGQLGVALVTAAPGFGNALGPLYMAAQGENPVLLLSGDSPVGQDGQGAFQEMDQVAVTRALTKFASRPVDAGQLARDTAQAIRVALSGRPGPVHLALPFDVLNQEVGDVAVAGAEALTREQAPPADADVQRIIDAIAGAARPVVITGPGLNRTRHAAITDALADALDAPVLTMESPRGLNDPSLGSFASLMQQADVVLSLGKKIDFTTGFGKSLAGRALMVDSDLPVLTQANAALGERLSLSLQADVVDTAQALIEAGRGGDKRATWREQMASAVAARASEPAAGGTGPMRPAVLCQAVQRLIDGADNPILVIDGGEFGQWAQACLSAPRRIINGPSGAIGGCLCYAIAAKIAEPDATVIVVMGDGTVGFHFAEFETAHRYGANITAVIGHDAKWNAEYQIQLREYGENRLLECELDETRYDQAAAGLGCHGAYVTDPSRLDDELRRAKDSGLPACVAVRIEGVPAPSGAGH